MKRLLVVHPILFGIFQVLFLYSLNASELEPYEIVVPLLAVTAAVLILWSAVGLLLKDTQKAGIIVSFIFVLFFSFGAMKEFLNATNLFDAAGWQASIVLPLWAAVLISVVYTIAKIKNDLRVLTKIMNVIAIVLTAMPAFMAVHSHAARVRHVQKIHLKGKPPKTSPDIYYIILDAYARPDILKKLYGYDNGEFVGFLRKKGFYIADRSKTNYCMTALSLASSLNFEYLDDPPMSLSRISRESGHLIKMIHDNNASVFLRKQGYKFVAFSTGYVPTDIKTSDIYLSSKWHLDEFDNTLLNSTPVPAIMEKLSTNFLDDIYRDNILYILQTLPTTAPREHPKFVFAHVTSPHPPFVFGRNGEPIPADKRFPFNKTETLDDKSRKDYMAEYIDQVIFIEKRVKAAIEGILSKSGTPPIIIIQADHGPQAYLDWLNPKNPGLAERMSIFNAYYLPGIDRNFLYREISPVNTFRLIFKYYFSADIELLKDRNNFSNPSYPRRFTDVSGTASDLRETSNNK